jgi:hypothetical protein
MPVPAPTINLPVPAAATAFEELVHLDFDIVVSQEGQSVVRVWARSGSRDSSNILSFDAYEWARFKQAVGAIDELLAKVESGGAVFRIGK